MKIGIYKNNNKVEATQSFNELSTVLSKAGIDYFNLRLKDETPDMCISIGGDGTFLKAAAFALKYDVPVFGLNLGTLGMLTEMDANNIRGTIETIINKEYRIEERTCIDVHSLHNGESEYLGTAVNDCVISQISINKVAYLELLVNEETVEIYPCDGIVLSTQTGSTGYSLSAGGPIVIPGADVMIASPKCPHFVNGRSVVTGPDATLSVKVVRSQSGVSVSLDGRETCDIQEGDKIICRKAEKSLKILRINPPGFFEALRTKNARRDYIMEMRTKERL